MADSSPSDWIQLKADSILQLILSCGCLKFWRLDTSYNWLYPISDSSSGSWMRLKSVSALRLTMRCGRLTFQWLDTSYSWFQPAADSSPSNWNRLAADLFFNISSKFKDLFCKMHHFYGLFSTSWFQLPLIQALATASRTFKKLE